MQALCFVRRVKRAGREFLDDAGKVQSSAVQLVVVLRVLLDWASVVVLDEREQQIIAQVFHDEKAGCDVTGIDARHPDSGLAPSRANGGKLSVVLARWRSVNGNQRCFVVPGWGPRIGNAEEAAKACIGRQGA